MQGSEDQPLQTLLRRQDRAKKQRKKFFRVLGTDLGGWAGRLRTLTDASYVVLMKFLEQVWGEWLVHGKSVTALPIKRNVLPFTKTSEHCLAPFETWPLINEPASYPSHTVAISVQV